MDGGFITKSGAKRQRLCISCFEQTKHIKLGPCYGLNQKCEKCDRSAEMGGVVQLPMKRTPNVKKKI